MATTPPLHRLEDHGVPGARTSQPSATALVDLGRQRHQGRAKPPGDYIREMTWPIVEAPSLMRLHLNRGKRSLVLDLRPEPAFAVLKELATGPTWWTKRSDPAVAGRGVGYEELRALNPIVFCSISGYGVTGPYRDYPSHGVASAPGPGT